MKGSLLWAFRMFFPVFRFRAKKKKKKNPFVEKRGKRGSSGHCLRSGSGGRLPGVLLRFVLERLGLDPAQEAREAQPDDGFPRVSEGVLPTSVQIPLLFETSPLAPNAGSNF